MACTTGTTQLDGKIVHQTLTCHNEAYLTFDDGIEAGTEEVVDLLIRKGIKGTFFLIGKRIESAYKRNRNMCLRVLKKYMNIILLVIIHILNDRPVQRVKEVREKILCKIVSPRPVALGLMKFRKIVLLMHERQFRKGKVVDGKVDLSNTEYLDKLGELIDSLKEKGIQFKALDKY